MELDDRAWNMLVKEEQTALSLQHGFNKSTWEAGEIMGKAHYKYLEIRQRAEKFLKMFTVHFESYGQLIPEKNIDPDLKRFLELTIGKRKTIKEAIDIIGKSSYVKPKKRDSTITLAILKLEALGTKESKYLMAFIKEFDRWNNFRILPKQFQEPSAYKRREKNKYKRLVKTLVSLHPFVVNKIIECYGMKEVGFCYYLPIIFDNYQREEIIRVKKSPYIINKISESGMYIFSSPEECKAYIDLIKSYNLGERNTCKSGQNFWPLFRDLIIQAINYKEVENISPIKMTLDYFNVKDDV